MDFVKFSIEHLLYPLMEARKGNHIRQNLRALQGSQSLPPAELQKRQGDKLRALLLHCAAHIPYYHDLIQEADPFAALRTLPVLTKERFRASADAFLDARLSPETLIANTSGGSTSEPVRFFMDRHTVEFYEAARWRGLSWYGVTPGSRSVMIWGNPLELTGAAGRKYRLKERYLKNRVIIPAYALRPEAIPGYLQKIAAFRPEYIYGYAGALHAFAELALARGLHLSLPLKAVVSTAETLHDDQRKTIGDFFGCPVVNEYGARDGGILAYECPQGGLHITAENALLEVVDPESYEPLPCGQSGLLLVTDLNNFVCPRLRYAIGDMAAFTDRVCACGRGLPLLASLDGREDDMFVTMDGRLVHGHAFNYMSRELQAVKKFQISQQSPQKARLLLVPHPDVASETLETFIQGVRKLLPGTDIGVHAVDDIPPSPSGKFRYAIREFKLHT